MAYFLENSPGSNGKYVSIEIPAPATGGGAFDRSFDIEFELNIYGSDLPFMGNDSSTDQLIFFTGGGLEIRRFAGSGTTEQIAIPGGYNSFKKYRLECREPSDATEPYITVFVDDSEIGTLPQTGGLLNFGLYERVFPLGNASREGGLKYLSYTDNINAANNRYYDADASNGTGSVLPETTGNGTDGTLVNFPTDDSQWAFYSTGPSLTITDPIVPGSATTFSTSGFVDPLTGVRITDAQGNVKELTLASQTSLSAPAVGDLDYALFGSVTLEVYNATESATATIAFNPPAGFSQIALEAGFATDINSFLYQYGGTPAVPDQFTYDPVSSGTAETLTLQTNGYWTATGYGEWTVYAIDATDGVMQSFPFVWDAPAIPGGSGKMTRRNVTLRAVTRRTLTARP